MAGLWKADRQSLDFSPESRERERERKNKSAFYGSSQAEAVVFPCKVQRVGKHKYIPFCTQDHNRPVLTVYIAFKACDPWLSRTHVEFLWVFAAMFLVNPCDISWWPLPLRIVDSIVIHGPDGAYRAATRLLCAPKERGQLSTCMATAAIRTS